MKKIALVLTACALALSGPAVAGPDTGTPIPPDTDPLYEFAAFMCSVTGIQFYCDYARDHKPKTGSEL